VALPDPFGPAKAKAGGLRGLSIDDMFPYSLGAFEVRLPARRVVASHGVPPALPGRRFFPHGGADCMHVGARRNPPFAFRARRAYH
jgi:hypothetical protein